MGITKIQLHTYELTPKAEPNRLSSSRPRRGVLLKVHYSDLPVAGHADLFSWPELGDAELDTLLASLRANKPLPHVVAALAWARLEAEAADNKHGLLSEMPIASHRTLTTLPKGAIDATTAKLKISAEMMNRWPEIEACLLQGPETLWRFDFNGLFYSKKEAQQFWRSVSPELKSRIDFLEDPYAADLMIDESALAIFDGVDVAADRAPRDLAQVWVVKPVYFTPETLLQEAKNFGGKIVVTSNMDHPLGQLTALAAAQMLAYEFDLQKCGLLTHELYQENHYSHWLRQNEDCLWPSYFGPGWGLTDELAKLAWSDL